jgi:hypothetical protein
MRKAQDDLAKHCQRFTDHMEKLPIELSGEIARLFVEKDHTASIPLSQVSKHWRTVVHNIPYLWNVLVLSKQRPKQKAKLWIELERSKGQIQELSIRSSAIDAPRWPDDFYEVFDRNTFAFLPLLYWKPPIEPRLHFKA